MSLWPGVLYKGDGHIALRLMSCWILLGLRLDYPSPAHHQGHRFDTVLRGEPGMYVLYTALWGVLYPSMLRLRNSYSSPFGSRHCPQHKIPKARLFSSRVQRQLHGLIPRCYWANMCALWILRSLNSFQAYLFSHSYLYRSVRIRAVRF